MHEFIEIASFITATGIMLSVIKKYFLNPIELSSIKTDLVNFIDDIEKGRKKSEIQILNAHELYDRYDKLGGNSYVHDHWEALKKAGKI